MIRVIGISHRLTPVHRREKAAVAADALPRTLQRVRARLDASECAILSTCNRTELYYVGDGAEDPRQAALEALVPDARARQAIPESELYVLEGAGAATHLCEVAAGLDSLILGEHEIVAQVKSSFQSAREAGCAGGLLTRLFDHAVRAGKRARAETSIASGIFSVGHCAARAAASELGDLNGKALLVIGAGRIAEATAKHLSHQGATPITVANRTLERAQEVAARLGGTAETIARLPELVAHADLIITCTSAPHFVLDARQVERAMGERGGRPMVIIDASVPRDVEPAAGLVAGVRLFNLDELEPVVAENAKAREGEVVAARAIIADEVQAFENWRSRGDIAPLIQALHGRVEEVRQECLDQARRRLGHLSPADLEVVERVTDLLVKRLLHAPTKALRAHPNGDPFTLSSAVRELFGLADGETGNTEASSDARASVTDIHHSLIAGGCDHVHVE